MTAAALESCAAGTMWTDYDPTPMTREWLVENGFLSLNNIILTLKYQDHPRRGCLTKSSLCYNGSNSVVG